MTYAANDRNRQDGPGAGWGPGRTDSGSNNRYLLRWTAGPLAGQQTPVYGQVTIGRDPNNDIALPPETKGVSRKHCLVAAAEGKLYVEDLGSAYGTVGNGIHRLPPNQVVTVNPGDRISLGSDEVAFTVEMETGVNDSGPGTKILDEGVKGGKKKTGLLVAAIILVLLAMALAVCYKMGIIGKGNNTETQAESTASPQVTDASSTAATPTPKPSATPTQKPSATATPKPSATPTPKPSATPTPKPSATATPTPSQGGDLAEKDDAEETIGLSFLGNRYNAGVWNVPVLNPEKEILKCTEFTLCFCYEKVDAKELGQQRVFVSLNQSNGAWLDCGTFNVEKQGEVYRKTIKFDKPRTVGGIAVLSTNATESSYSVNAWLEDLKYS